MYVGLGYSPKIKQNPFIVNDNENNIKSFQPKYMEYFYNSNAP